MFYKLNIIDKIIEHYQHETRSKRSYSQTQRNSFSIIYTRFAYRGDDNITTEREAKRERGRDRGREKVREREGEECSRIFQRGEDNAEKRRDERRSQGKGPRQS